MKNYSKANDEVFLIFVCYIFFLFSIFDKSLEARELESNNKVNVMLITELSLPKSRLLLDNKKSSIDKKKENDLKPAKENKKIELHNSEDLKIEDMPKLKEIKIDSIEKEQSQLIFNLKYPPEGIEPFKEDLKAFIKKINKIKIKNKITIKGYASKSEGDSTSKVRRLSLKRALYVRSILLKNNFKLSNIQVKALGHNIEFKDDKDFVLVEVN